MTMGTDGRQDGREPPSEGAVGGVVFRIGDERYFLPAAVASKVLPMPGVARVPGAPTDLVGVALVEGDMVPVVAVGDLDGRGPRRRELAASRPRAENRPMLVCVVMGERVGLVGLEILASGFFTRAEADGVLLGDVAVPLFDVGAVVARLGEGRWAV